MKRGIPWLKGESARERKRNEASYYRKMFPFGEEQKETEVRLLRACTKGRMKDSELLYQLLCVREALLEEEEDDQREAIAEWKKSPLARGLSKEDRQTIYALASISIRCQSLEEFPDAESLKKTAEDILSSQEQMDHQ